MQVLSAQGLLPLLLWEKVHFAVGPEGDQGLYVARIEDFAQGLIVVSEPEYLHGSTLLTEDCEILVLITREDAVYQFYSRIHRHASGERILYTINPPDSIRRVQRRQHVRIEKVERIRVALMDTTSPVSLFTWQDALMENISGSGLLAQCPMEVSEGDLVLLEIDYFRRHDLPERIAGKVRRTFQRGGVGFAGIEFLLADQLDRYFSARQLDAIPGSAQHFDQRAQHRLVTQIFREQVDLRRRGLL